MNNKALCLGGPYDGQMMEGNIGSERLRAVPAASDSVLDIGADITMRSVVPNYDYIRETFWVYNNADQSKVRWDFWVPETEEDKSKEYVMNMLVASYDLKNDYVAARESQLYHVKKLDDMINDDGAAQRPLLIDLMGQLGFIIGFWKAMTFGKVWRHKKRGSTYRVLTDNARLQTSMVLKDDDPMVVYQDANTGKISVRHPEEFFDGRFE